MSATRGPSGQAPTPPAWLDTTDLPVDVIPAGTPLIRVHRLTHNPIFFGPGAGIPPTYRFDSLSGAFGILYVGRSVAAAVVETLLRNPARKMVSYSAVAARASSDIRSIRDLRLVRLYGRGLQQVGCDNAISTGPVRTVRRVGGRTMAPPGKTGRNRLSIPPRLQRDLSGSFRAI